MLNAILPYAREIGHWIGLLPLAACLWLFIRNREPSNDALLLSSAFAVSFAADTIGHQLFGAGVNMWWLTYVYAPVQFALFALVVLPTREFRSFAVAGMLMVAIISALNQTLGKPETMLQVSGGILLGWLMWPQPSPYRLAVFVYCAVGAPFLLLMGAIPTSNAVAWNVAWLGYQTVRVIALVLMALALIWPSTPRLEVSDGLGTARAAAGGWQKFRRHFQRSAGSAHRPATSAARSRKTG